MLCLLIFSLHFNHVILGGNIKYYTNNKLVYFENMYSPSQIIDLVWKLLIQNSKVYKEFCIELWGSFIDRVEPNSKTYLNFENTCKYDWMDQFLSDYNSYFKKYDPLHDNISN